MNTFRNAKLVILWFCTLIFIATIVVVIWVNVIYNCAVTEVEGIQQFHGDLFPVAGALAKVYTTLLGAW